MNLIFFCVLIILAIFAFYNGHILRRYPLSSEKLAGPLRIVLISDLHSDYNKRLVSLIKEQSPDIMLLAGDIIDDMAPIDGALKFLEEISGLCPTYYVTGNHEYWSGDIAGMREIIERYGITILSDEYERITVNNSDLIIAGIDDPAKAKYEDSRYSQALSMKNAFSMLPDEDAYKILIAHRPERIEDYKPYGFDLVVSGHAHGGQWRIPFILNGLYVPNQGLFPKYAGGLYSHDKLTHIISRGCGNNVYLPRIFNPPEIVVIELGNAAI